VVEQQVQPVIAPVDHHPFLALNEREANSQLEQKALHLVENRPFEVGLAVFRRQAEEVQNVGVPKREGWLNGAG
jgi:hypothetical protein